MKVSEPAVAYSTSYVQGLKKQIMTSLDATNDEEKLQRCLELLRADNMPCSFTEEELDEEIRLSEASGYATDEEIKSMFAKWGVRI